MAKNEKDKQKEKKKLSVSRRDFLVTGGAAIAGGALSAFTLSNGSEAGAATQAGAATTKGGTKRYSFETPPAPITDKDIVETVTKDIVVVGLGPAGAAASLAAAEKGASVVVLEAYHRAASPGAGPGVINSRRQKQVTEIEPLVEKLAEASIGRADKRLLRLWAENSGKVADWYTDIAESLGVKVGGMGLMVPPNDNEEGKDIRCTIPYGQKLGIEYRYNIRGRQLIRENNNTGRVTAVIASNSDGKYVKFIANKAVILATGSFHDEPEMMEKYCPWVPKDIISLYDMDTGYGDGPKMALWVGAEIPNMPLCPMIHPNSTNKQRVMSFVVSGSSFLFVNKLGERFTNESASHEQTMNALLKQPDNKWFKIFDGKAVKKGNQRVEEALKTGEALMGNTIAELAEALGADPKVLTKTISRWNELIEAGVDYDFGRDFSGGGGGHGGISGRKQTRRRYAGRRQTRRRYAGRRHARRRYAGRRHADDDGFIKMHKTRYASLLCRRKAA